MVTYDTPRVWIGSLGAYNAGRLIGNWSDATDASELADALEAVQRDAYTAIGPEAGEEYMLADREGFGDLIGEYDPLERVATIGALIAEHGPAFVAWAEDGNDPTDAAGFEDAYNGVYTSDREFAESFAEDIGAIHADAVWPYTCIDWDQATRELFMDYWSAPDGSGGVYVFRR